SEGVKVADGRYVCELSDNVDYVDAFGHKQLAGTARFLAGKVAEKYGVKTRAIELSSLQRCASHIMARIDMTEAYNAGGAAVKAAFEGLTGQVITLKRVSDDPYMCITEPADVHFIANVEKKVPLEWITEDGANVKPELVHYIYPLIQAEIAPLWINGLPRHIRLHAKSTIK
ncbi:MAG: 6-phosphofructokinase, partial [Clostridia bacterium]|nr:6-phosphofructokinase [Clostridia bacterium]